MKRNLISGKVLANNVTITFNSFYVRSFKLENGFTTFVI